MDSDVAKEEIKRRADLAAIVQQYVPLQRSGRRLKGRCPFHQEKTPSFFVDPAGGFWKCFGCGAGGDVFSFLMKIEGLTFPEAAERLANQLGIQWRSEPVDQARVQRRRQQQSALELAAEHFRHNLASPLGAGAREYLEKRGLLPETVEAFGLGFAPAEWDDLARFLGGKAVPPAMAQEAGLIRARQSHSGFYDVFRNRVMFPISDASGRILGFGGRTLDPEESAKYLNSADTPLFKKGHHVYGLPQARAAMTAANFVVLVEGYTDVLALHQAGFAQVVAALGTALTEDHVRLLGRYVETVVLCYDADTAGQAAALRNLEVFERVGVDAQVVVLPQGLDPDELVRERGLAAWEECLAARLSLAEYQLDRLFAAYRDQGPAALDRAAVKAVEVLAKVQQRPRREALLRRAAGLWAAKDPAGTAAMERTLQLELERKMPAPSRYPRRRSRDDTLIRKSLAEQAAGLSPGRQLPERLLLTLALQDLPPAELIFRVVEPADFALEEHRALALALEAHTRQAQVEDDGFQPVEVVQKLEAGDARAYEVGTELLLAPVGGFAEKDIVAAAEKLRSYREAGGLQAVYVIPQAEAPETGAPGEPEDFEALLARVNELNARGELSHDDPDYQRYQRLVRRSRGKGEYDWWADGSAPPRAPGADQVPSESDEGS